ncbi:hypothetical protein OROGR_032447 [Orobanche gracilis]
MPSQEILKILQKKRVARILVFKIRPSQEILKIRDGTPLEAEGILTYRKDPRNCSIWHFYSKLDVPSNVVQKKIVAQIMVFKIRPSQEILKIRDATPLEAEGILTYRKRPSQEILKIRDGTPLEKKRVARILVFKIRPSQEILKIRDGTPLEAEGILTYRKDPRNCSVWHFSSKLDVPSNVVQKKKVALILVFKIRPSQEILKIRDGTALEAEEILTYRKRTSKLLDLIMVFKIRPSQEILKIRDATPLEAEGILTYRKDPRNCSVWHFSSKLDVPSNVVQKKRVALILVFKIRPSQEILKIRDGTPLEAEEILTYRKRTSKLLDLAISRNSKIPRPSQEILKIRDVQKKRVARILVFKIRPSQEILKIRDGTPLEAEGILTYRKDPRNCSIWHFYSKLDVPSNVVQKKIVAQIMVFKIRPSQEILKIRDATPLEAEGILTYRKRPSKLLEILKIRDVQKKRVARILVFKIRPSQEILKIRDGTPLEAEGILTYRKDPRNCSVWHFSSKLDVPSNVVQKKKVALILVFKIRPSQEILKIRDGTALEIMVFKIRPSQEILKIRDATPLEAEGILTYRKRAEGILTYRKDPRNCSVWHFSSKLDVPSNVVQKKRVALILVFKIRPSQEILKIRDGTPLEKRVARILVFKIRPSQEILKIRDGTPLEAEGILTYRKDPRNCSVWHFSSKLDVPSNVVQKKKVALILVFKIRPSQEILKIRDGTALEKIVARIMVFKIRPSQEILKIRDGTPLEAEGILTYRKRAEGILTYRKDPRNCSVWHFSSKLDVPSNVVQKKRVALIMVFKIRPSQEILKIRDGTPLEAEEILTYRKRTSKLLDLKRVARILVFKIRPSQEILKIRDGTPLEAEGILTYRKDPRNCSVWHFSSKLDVPSNVVQKKKVALILVFKIRPSQEILKIRDGTALEIMVFKIRPSQEILKIRDATPLEAEGILTYRKRAEGILTYRKDPRNCSVWHFSSKLDVPSNVVQKKRVALILVFKIRPSQEILKIRDGTPLEAEEILTYRKRTSKLLDLMPSQEILKIRDGTPLEMPSREILKIRDGTPLEIMVFKIRPSQEILKIRDATPLEAEGILTYRKRAEGILTYIKDPRNCSVWHFSSKLDVPSNVVQKKRVALILVFKIRPSQEILKIRDGTPLEAEGILTYRKDPRNCSVWHFSSKLDVPSNVVQKKRVALILVFKIRPSQEILKIRDGTPLEAEEILTYRKRTSKLLDLALF